MSLPCLDHAHLTLIKSSITGRMDEHHRQKRDQMKVERDRMSRLSPDKPATPVRSRRPVKPTLEIPPQKEGGGKKLPQKPKESPKGNAISPLHTEAKLKIMMRHDITKCPKVEPLSSPTKKVID